MIELLSCEAIQGAFGGNLGTAGVSKPLLIAGVAGIGGAGTNWGGKAAALG